MVFSRLVLVVSTALLVACSADVALTDEAWQCKDKHCEVSFVLVNTSDQPIEARYAIRAQSAVQTINSDMRDGLVVAEIKDSIMLEAGASQEVSHQLEATRVPTNIKFSAWVK